jgi:hypothetical protein
MNSTLGFILFMLVVIGLLFRNHLRINKYGRSFLSGSTLQDYRTKYPDSFDRNGKFIRCHSCSGSQIWIKQAGNTKYGLHQSHVCRQCGQELWRSNLLTAN